jgi:hypothetical protein
VRALGPLTLASRRSENEATPGGGLSAEAWRIVAMVTLVANSFPGGLTSRSGA